jgi:hypothetical protein
MLMYNEKYDEVKDFLLKTEITNDEMFEYFLVICGYNNYDLIDFIIENFEFDVNDENSKCETILFRLSFNDKHMEVIHYLLEEYNVRISPKYTVYFPLLSCLTDNFNKGIFYLLMEYINFNDINIIDNTDNTLLYNLIPYGDLKAVKVLCESYITHSSKETFMEWLMYNNHIEYALKLNYMHIVRYLISFYDIYPLTKHLTIHGKYLIQKENDNADFPERKILDSQNRALQNRINIIKVDPSFNEFYVIFNKIINIIWDPIILSDVRKIYLLSETYTFDEIYHGITLCIANDYRLDVESILYFMKKKRIDDAIMKLQVIYKYNKKKKLNNPLKVCVKNIQCRYRRKKYLTRMYERCNICVDYLIEHECKKLSCDHIFHSTCISKWRKIQNKCPNCRTIINKPPITI